VLTKRVSWDDGRVGALFATSRPFTLCYFVEVGLYGGHLSLHTDVAARAILKLNVYKFILYNVSLGVALLV
jgi:hypothetical protein